MVLAVTIVIVAVSMNMVTSVPPKVNGQPKIGVYSASDNGVVTTNGAYNGAQSL